MHTFIHIQPFLILPLNTMTIIKYINFLEWIAYQDPNPHGMQQIGLSTK